MTVAVYVLDGSNQNVLYFSDDYDTRANVVAVPSLTPSLAPSYTPSMTPSALITRTPSIAPTIAINGNSTSNSNDSNSVFDVNSTTWIVVIAFVGLALLVLIICLVRRCYWRCYRRDALLKTALPTDEEMFDLELRENGFFSC